MPPEPAGSLRFRLDRVAVGVDQQLAAADMVGLADQPVLLHPLDQPGGTVVADAELTLQIAGRSLLALRDDLDRLAVELGFGIVLAHRLAVEQIAAILRLLGNGLDIVRYALLAPMFGNGADFLV